jgi:hypothetical protein
MKYMLLIYSDEAGFRRLAREQVDEAVAAYAAYTEALKKARVYVDSNRLQPTASAASIRIADGKTTVLNGPYAESKEQLGGYFMIDVPDMDTAMAWAARCPGASHGTVEIRPLWAM